MRQIIGWLILIIGFFILGVYLNYFFSKKTQTLSPVPSDEEIRVIMLTPVPTKNKN